MADKKLKKLSKKKDDRSGSLKAQASQIWLAGLGAFARAQEEGGKIFEHLVKEGREIEARGRSVTTAKVNEVRGAVEGTVGQVQARATRSWDKLEKVFEERVARALGGLGVPTAKDIQQLTKRVEELQSAVDEFKAVPTKKPTVSKAAPKKAPVKKAAVKKAASKKATSKKAASKKVAAKGATGAAPKKKTLKKKSAAKKD